MRNEVKIEMLEAGNGDCFFVSWEDSTGFHKILIDTGIKKTAKHIKTILESESQPINALFITHVCDDHVGGAIKLVRDHTDIVKEKISKIYINSPETINVNKNGNAGVSHGYTFQKLITDNEMDCKLESCTIEDGVVTIGDAKLNILSPSSASLATIELIKQWKKEKDKAIANASAAKHVAEHEMSICELNELSYKNAKKYSQDYVNASSIAFTLEVNDKKILFLGDSHPDDVVDSLVLLADNCKFDAVKVSHHGSKFNLSKDFIEKVTSRKFIISTDGGRGRSNHPDPEVIAKLYMGSSHEESVQFIFNYQEKKYSNHLKGLINDKKNYPKFELMFNQKEILV